MQVIVVSHTECSPGVFAKRCLSADFRMSDGMALQAPSAPLQAKEHPQQVQRVVL